MSILGGGDVVAMGMMIQSVMSITAGITTKLRGSPR